MSEPERDESGARGVRRIVHKRISDAAGLLRSKNVNDADVHEARKEIKKARAGLRLLRDAVGKASYERDNVALRDATRPLSAARDGKVLLETLDQLVERYGAASHAIVLDRFRTALRRERTAARRSLTHATIAKQRKALQDVADRSESWRVGDGDWEVIGAGLARGYRNGRKAMTAARSRSDDDLHEWRKQVKYLWHQLQVLQPIWPGLISELADQAHKLADYLGDDHDLVVLRQRVVDNEKTFQDGNDGALLALLDRCRERLQEKAFVLGERIFEEKPKQFHARFGKYWNAWRRQGQS
jgi:CHAD domain-containing protein